MKKSLAHLLFVFIVVSIVPLTGCDKTKEPTITTKTEKPEMQNKTKNTESKLVKLETTYGDILIELNEKAAPVTVKNFISYVEEGFYNGTIFHRVISGFMVQGGGFTPDMSKKSTHPAIINEANNGLKNNRGTVAMARTNNPNSATSQFFINHKDNDSLNYPGPYKPGYAVFGKVIEGMDVVDKIAAVKTTRKGPSSDVPVETIEIKSAVLISQ